uniref:E3 ubiquitin-protein ligase CHFR-like n=1 Tax=Saccoglossus kowalevskii TaxID=10224 RepID=A0ABM0MGB1_SACKO|nr:PREDICTED: E3 ubiquitin-protein ligase CHFR-like [Saccoglossus kowalevskii]
MSVNDEAWAQLVSTTEVDSSPIIIASDEFTIGRAQMCELSINNNKMVSGKHCKIIKDSKTMKTWLQDTSTNGTLINMKTKVNKGQKVELKHGDEIHIVFRKDATDNNVAYLFQDLAELEKEMLEETLEYDQLSDDVTQEYESIEIDNVTSKRPIIQSESSIDDCHQET